MNRIQLNDLFFNARFSEHIQVGLTKDNIEQLLGIRLESPNIETPDLNLYFVELEPGLVVTVNFDKRNVCYEINLELEENKETFFYISLGESIKEINGNISFEYLLSILSKLRIGWKFDRKRVYLQTVCILFDNGLRLYYSFGNKKQKDYGLFSIKLIDENHELTTLL